MFGRIAGSLFLAAFVVACGPDERPNNNVIVPTNVVPNNATNNGTTMTNNETTQPINNGFGEECRGVECPDAERCVRGICVASTALVSCEDFEDLGTVGFDEVLMGSGDTSEYVDAVKAYCAGEELYSGAENAFRFTVDEEGSARFTVSTTDPIDWLIEVRDACDNPASPVDAVENNDTPLALCTTSNSTSFAVNPGREYWVIVEPNFGIDKGTFDWTLELEQDLCDTGRTCEDATTILHCFAGREERSLSCGTPCTDGVCEGDSCDNALVVTASMSWSGDASAFTNNLDFGSQPSCSIDGVEGIPSPGPELVLSLPGLAAGQQVTVDASMMDDNDNAIFVLDSCSDSAGCLTARDLGDVLTFTVPEAGDYFVVIDKFTNSVHPFNYTIDIE